MNTSVELCGVTLKNPVMTASGTFGSGAEYSEFTDLNRLGAVVTKGVANVPWPGNPTPRVAEVYGGMLNAVGLQNPGIDLFCERDIPFLKKYDTKISYIIFVIDELIQVVSDKDCIDILLKVMSKCASYGIYFLLATQDCTKETIGRCKMNCSQIIGFHTFDQTDSDTLIGKGYNLQDINVKGRCKIKNSEGVVETQIFYLDEDRMEELLKPYLRESKKDKVDQYVNMLNISKIADFMNKPNADKKD